MLMLRVIVNWMVSVAVGAPRPSVLRVVWISSRSISVTVGCLSLADAGATWRSRFTIFAGAALGMCGARGALSGRKFHVIHGSATAACPVLVCHCRKSLSSLTCRSGWDCRRLGQEQRIKSDLIREVYSSDAFSVKKERLVRTVEPKQAYVKECRELNDRQKKRHQDSIGFI